MLKWTALAAALLWVCEGFAPAWSLVSVHHNSRRSGVLFAAQSSNRDVSSKPPAKRRRGKKSDLPDSTIVINRRISREARTPEDILAIYDEREGSFAPVNYATTLTWLAKRRPKRGYSDRSTVSKISKVAARTREKLDDASEVWSARTLANAGWASAKLFSSTQDAGLRRELIGNLHVVAQKSCLVIDEFKPQELANVAWAMATANVKATKLVETLAASAVPRIGLFSAQEMANLVWALARLFGQAIGDSGASSSSRDESRAAARCNELYGAVADEAKLRFHEFKPQELANTVWAVATTGFVPGDNEEEFWDAAVKAMGDKLLVAELSSGRPTSPAHEFAQPQNVANVVWSIAKVMPGGCSAGARQTFFDIVARVSIESIGEFNPQELGNVAWSFATAKESSDPLFDSIAGAAESKLNRFIPQNLANIVWAFATAGRGQRNAEDVKFFNAVAKESTRRLQDFKPQEIANTAWAFATAGVRSPRLFDALAQESRSRLSSFSDQGIANLAWAFSTSDEAVNHVDLFHDIAAEAVGRVPNLLPQGLANVAWSYANADLRAPKLFDAIAVEIVGPGPSTVSRRTARLKPQEFANLAWAFAKVNYAERPAVYEALATGMLALAARHGDDLGAAGLTHQELANLAWAYACADHVDPALLGLLWRSVVDRARKNIARADASALPAMPYHDDSSSSSSSADSVASSAANCSHAYDRNDDEAITAAWGFNLEERRQLQQVVLHARYEAKGQAAIVSDIARAPPAFLAVLRNALATLDSHTSRSQVEVGETAELLGIQILEELVISDGLSIDVALQPVSQRIGIEFDGPWHYFRNDPRVETGRTVFKKRLLAACGWTVLHVPYWEWGALDRTPEARTAYLKMKLTELLLQKRRRTEKRAPKQASAVATGERRLDLREKKEEDDLSKLKVSELRLLCAERGIEKTVKRTEGDARVVLVTRLREHAAAAAAAAGGRNK